MEEISRVTRSKDEARAAYDRLSRWYDLVSGNWEEKPRRAGLQILDLHPGETVLDIGPGTGHSLVTLAEETGPGGQVHALDLSPGMLAVARGNLSKTGQAEAVHMTGGDALHLPYRSGCFAAIFTSFTLELFDTPEIPGVLQECRRVLQPEGRMCVISLSKAAKSQAMIKLYEWSHARFPAAIDCRPIFVQRSIELAGFHVQVCMKMSLWGLPVEIVLANP